MPKSFNKGVYWKEGDTVKDTNPRCTHYGSVGKVVKIGDGRTTFVVTNNGDTYKKGDKLTKTDVQLEKQAIAVSTAVALGSVAVMGIGKAVKGIGKMMKGRGAAVHAAKAKQLQQIGRPGRIMPKMAEDNTIKVDPKYLNIKALPSGKPMVVHTPMDSLMYNVLSDTTKAKQNQAVLDSIRSGKLDPKDYNNRIAKKNLKKEGEVNMFKFNGQNKVAAIYDAASSQEHMYPESARMGKIQGILPGAAGGVAIGAVATDKIKNKKLKGIAMLLGGLGGGAIGADIGQRIFGGPTKKEELEMAKLVEDAKSALKTASVEKQAGMSKMKAFVDMGESVENAARKAYPDAPESAISDYVAKYKMNKDSKKTKKMYVDKVVMKRANLIQKAAGKLDFNKIANATLGYGGMLPGGTRKAPGQVGAVMPNASPTGRGTH